MKRLLTGALVAAVLISQTNIANVFVQTDAATVLASETAEVADAYAEEPTEVPASANEVDEAYTEEEAEKKEPSDPVEDQTDGDVEDEESLENSPAGDSTPAEGDVPTVTPGIGEDGFVIGGEDLLEEDDTDLLADEYPVMPLYNPDDVNGSSVDYCGDTEEGDGKNLTAYIIRIEGEDIYPSDSNEPEPEPIGYYATLVITGSGKMRNYTAETGNLRPWDSQYKPITEESGTGQTQVQDPEQTENEGTQATVVRIKAIEIDSTVESIGDYAFYEMGYVESITIIGDDSKLGRIGENAFNGCSVLTSIDIPDSVTEIGGSAFKDCTMLASVTLPSNEGFTAIGKSVFENCKNLGSITVPDVCQNVWIAASAFENCEKLTSINLENAGQIDENAFAGTKLSMVVYPDSINVDDGAFPDTTVQVKFTDLGNDEIAITAVIGLESGKTVSPIEIESKTGKTVVSSASSLIDAGLIAQNDGHEHIGGSGIAKCVICGADTDPAPEEHVHTYPAEWRSSGQDGHWQECSDKNCPDPQRGYRRGTHDSLGVDGVCSLCGYDSNQDCTHSFGEWSSSGDIHSRECSVCHEWETHNAEFGEWEVIDGTQHKRVCSKCDIEETHNAKYGEWKSVDGTQHKRECSESGCNYAETDNHFMDGNKCTTCGYTKPTQQPQPQQPSTPSTSGSSSSTSSTHGGGGSSADAGHSRGDEATTVTTVVVYTVQPGDTLSKIALKYYGSTSYWTKIFEDNKDTIKDPNKIYVGQQINIYLTQSGTAAEVGAAGTGTTGEGTYYTVVSGDNLYKIAKKVYGDGKDWRRIYGANDTITDASRIYVGQVLFIPEL